MKNLAFEMLRFAQHDVSEEFSVILNEVKNLAFEMLRFAQHDVSEEFSVILNEVKNLALLEMLRFAQHDTRREEAGPTRGPGSSQGTIL